VLAPPFGTWFGELIKRRGIDTTNGPAVAGLVIEHMGDKCQVNVDLTGGWGGSPRDPACSTTPYDCCLRQHTPASAMTLRR
jgi:hypothetical protein